MLGIGKFLQSFTEEYKQAPENVQDKSNDDLDFFEQLTTPIATPTPQKPTDERLTAQKEKKPAEPVIKS